jgi:hemerythrin-like domain-containing protein
VQARRLRRAAEADEAEPAEAAVKGFLDFWQKDTALHFRKEEEVLLPIMARYGGDISQEPLVEMIEDHARIRGLVMQLSDELIGGNVRLETLHEVGELLEAHIRLEERVVFPLIEESLPEAALTELAARLEVKDAGPAGRAVGPCTGALLRAVAGSGRQRGWRLRLDSSGRVPLYYHEKQARS